MPMEEVCSLCYVVVELSAFSDISLFVCSSSVAASAIPPDSPSSGQKRARCESPKAATLAVEAAASPLLVEEGSSSIGSGAYESELAEAKAQCREAKGALSATRIELETVRQELKSVREDQRMENMVHASSLRREAEFAKDGIKLAERKFYKDLGDARRAADAKSKADYEEFDADRKRQAEFQREDLQRMELQVKQAVSKADDCSHTILYYKNCLAEEQSTAKNSIETLQSFLTLERQAGAMLRCELAVNNLELGKLRSNASKPSAELIHAQNEHNRCKLDQFVAQIRALELSVDFLRDQLDESKVTIKKQFDIETNFNDRLRKQATTIELLRDRIIGAGLGSYWDHVARNITLTTTPSNVVYRAEDGPMQMGSACRFAGPSDM